MPSEAPPRPISYTESRKRAEQAVARSAGRQGEIAPSALPQAAPAATLLERLQRAMVPLRLAQAGGMDPDEAIDDATSILTVWGNFAVKATQPIALSGGAAEPGEVAWVDGQTLFDALTSGRGTTDDPEAIRFMTRHHHLGIRFSQNFTTASGATYAAGSERWFNADAAYRVVNAAAGDLIQ